MDLCVFADLETDRLIWHEDSPALAAVLFCWRVRDWGRLPWWLNGQEFACLCIWCGFNPWVRKIPWQKKWLPTLVFLPGRSHGQRSLAGYSPWGCKDMTEQTHTHTHSWLRIPFSSPGMWGLPQLKSIQPTHVWFWYLEFCLLSHRHHLSDLSSQLVTPVIRALAFISTHLPLPSHPSSAQNIWGDLKALDISRDIPPYLHCQPSEKLIHFERAFWMKEVRFVI